MKPVPTVPMPFPAVPRKRTAYPFPRSPLYKERGTGNAPTNTSPAVPDLGLDDPNPNHHPVTPASVTVNGTAPRTLPFTLATASPQERCKQHRHDLEGLRRRAAAAGGCGWRPDLMSLDTPCPWPAELRQEGAATSASGHARRRATSRGHSEACDHRVTRWPVTCGFAPPIGFVISGFDHPRRTRKAHHA